MKENGNKTIARFVFVVIAVFFCGTSVVRAQRFAGVVVDSAYRTPVPYAAVYVRGTAFGAVADNVGRFSFDAPRPVCADTLVVAAEGFGVRLVAASDIETPADMCIGLVADGKWETGLLFGEKTAGSPRKTAPVLARIARAIADDWVPLGNAETNAFDLGKIRTIPGFNPLEGFRIRLGGASNARLSSRFFVKGYAAYGFRDKKTKYRGELVRSFHEKAYFEEEFPKNNLRLVFENDLYSPGEMHPRQGNDLLLFTRRFSAKGMAYRRFADLSYEREHRNGTAYCLWIRRSHLTPQNAETHLLPGSVNLSASRPALRYEEAGLLLRYTVREAYRQQKRKRISVEPSSPRFLLGYSAGVFDAGGKRNLYHRLDLSMQKRFFAGSAGEVHLNAQFSKLWNDVPAFLLLFPNQQAAHVAESNLFFLMRPMEFPAHEQYTLQSVFVGEDLLFSKTELLNALGFREFVSFKLAYGKLNETDCSPAVRPGAYGLPRGSQCYRGEPYLEASAGITRILGLLRIEYVHRFTHRRPADGAKWLIRMDIAL